MSFKSNVNTSSYNIEFYRINPASKKLIRIISKDPLSNYDTYVSKASSNSTSSYLFLQTFDIETEQGSERPVSKNLFDLRGMSQIFLENTLYLCGTSSESNDEFSSSFLYSINALKEPLSISLEVNTCHPHYYPSLTILRNEYLIVIGGLNSKKCELYSITNKKWKELPELPEERYGASAICDNISNRVYLIGGYNHTSKKCCMTLLKLNVNKSVKWDTILNIHNAEILARMNTSIVKIDDGRLLILGGEDGEGKRKEDIVEINLKEKVFHPKIIESKFAKPPKFVSMRFALSGSNEELFAMDDNEEEDMNIVHKIEKDFPTILYIDDTKIKDKIK